MSRKIIGNSPFVESYISAHLHVCQQSDLECFYAKANSDTSLQLTGVSAPYEVLATAECVIDTSQIEFTTAIHQRISFLKE